MNAAVLQRLAWPALALAAALAARPAAALAAPGEALPNPELPTLDGGRATLLSTSGEVSVFVFARPGQDHSARTLREVAGCVTDFRERRVRWVVVMSAAFPKSQVRAAMAEAGLEVPVLLDAGDALYDRLGVRLHPVVGIADRTGRLAAMMPYQAVNYCEAMKARVRFLLGEIDEAALERALSPARADMPGASPKAVANRDLNLGRRQLERGMPEKALASARSALLRDADCGPAHALAAQSLAALGRCPEAKPEIEAALRADPRDPGALAARAACAR
ncbi:MAG TPA: hypothetical protein VMT17_02365 [Anaeromyxobacteraceae bacterium]|nr:hypothetical protein [Anaeromyxobacteraceae bacterium]